MPHHKFRQKIINKAAHLMYGRQETGCHRAKMRAARQLYKGWVKSSHLPSNQEIGVEVQRLVCLREGEYPVSRLREMRFHAFRLMKRLENFQPYIMGAALTGSLSSETNFSIHLKSKSIQEITDRLDWEEIEYKVVHEQIQTMHETLNFPLIQINDRYPAEISIDIQLRTSSTKNSSIKRNGERRASLREFEELLLSEYPDHSLDEELVVAHYDDARFNLYRSLLSPLHLIDQDHRVHPEGDVLYHSLQVFELARNDLPYDEEFLLAALLHDVGKGLDRYNHVEMGIEALGESISSRTRWFIQHQREAHALQNGTLGVRARRRLHKSEDFEALQIFQQCDLYGRTPGVDVPDLDEALDHVQNLSRFNG